MKSFDEIEKKIPGNKNPFQVPDAYFESFGNKVMDKIREEEKADEPKVRRLTLRPYLSIAATIAGFAIISIVVLQSVIKNRVTEDYYYDLAFSEESSIMYDESSLADSYNYLNMEEEDQWYEEAVNYLASNEVYLEYLLASN